MEGRSVRTAEAKRVMLPMKSKVFRARKLV